MFFPGTSTLQTRAKYFLLVPYACKDMEHSRQTDPNKLLEDLDNLERRFTEKLLNQEDTDGVIGKRSLASKQCIGLIRSILRHMTRFQSICRASWHASF
ncbi:MAG: hypothetical protein IJU79_02975 [Desulfovibrionaceae bacterium]|nr:hypothetical protein [Desulfovibrionaceae bacterium]